MTETTAVSPTDPKKKSPRPGPVRILSGYFVDFLFAAFLAWVGCFSFNGPSYWMPVTFFLWGLEVFWCRERLIPTAGEYALGIRYMKSSSSHVIADILVIHPKLVLNGFLLFGGVVDLAFSFCSLCGWTFLGKAVIGGFILESPFSLVYWVVYGFLIFLAATSLLGGSKNAVWLVPLIHAWFLFDFHQSFQNWTIVLTNSLIFTPWVTALILNLGKYQSTLILGLFSLYSLYLLAVVAFSRKHLVN